MCHERKVALASTAVALSIAVAGSAVFGDDALLRQIHGAWKERQDRVRTLELQWTETHTYAPGSMSFDDDPSGAYPADESVVEVKGTLSLDGPDKWRVEWNGKQWNNLTGRFEATHDAQVCDGTTLRAFVGVDSRTLKSHPRGRIAAVDPDPAKRSGPTLGAVFNTYRPLIRPLGQYDVHGFMVTVPDTAYRNRPCALVERAKPGKVRHKTWVALDGQFEVLRWAHEVPILIEGPPDTETGEASYHEGDAMMETSAVEIQCVPHPVAGVAVTGWIATGSNQSPHPRLDRRVEAVVHDFRVNEPIDASRFQFDFPPDTEVVDVRQQPPAIHIVRTDGTTRPVLRQERARNVGYEEYLATEAGDAGRPASPRSSAVYLLALGVAALAAAGWLAWSKTRF